jgi:anti-sigma factor RsiW
MKCGKVQKLISADLDGGLPDTRREALEEHLAGCGRCRAFKAELGVAAEGLETWAAPDPREGFASRTLARIHGRDPGRLPGPGWLEFVRPAPLGLGAAAFLFGVALVVLANGEQVAEPQRPQAGLDALASQYLEEPTTDPVEASLLVLLPEKEE